MPLITTFDDITVPFTHLYYGSAGGADSTGASATEVYRIAYSDLWSFVLQIAGGQPFSFGLFILYSSPLQYDKNPFLFARSCSWENVGADPNSLSVYTDVLVTINFATLPYDSTKNYSLELAGSGNFITVPNGTYHFNTSLLPIDQSLGIVVPQMDIRISLQNLTTVDASAFLPYIGTVNDTAFALCPAETVLFEAPTSVFNNRFDGKPQYNLQLVFKYRPTNWNKAFDPTTGLLDYVDDFSGNRPYARTEFNDIIIL